MLHSSLKSLWTQARYTLYCATKVLKSQQWAETYRVCECSETVAQTIYMNEFIYEVDLKHCTCKCMRWQKTLILCRHAIAVIFYWCQSHDTHLLWDFTVTNWVNKYHVPLLFILIYDLKSTEIFVCDSSLTQVSCD